MSRKPGRPKEPKRDPLAAESAGNSVETATTRIIGRPFQKGESGNPNGRPPMDASLKKRCRDLTPEMIDVLVQIAKGADKGSAQVSAARTILAYGHGTPPNSDLVERDVDKMNQREAANEARRLLQEWHENPELFTDN